MPLAARLNTYAVFAAMALSACVMAGCANVDSQQPTLSYPQADSQARVSKDKQIILNPFLDHRADKSNVGTVESAFGLRSQPIVPANDVSAWVMDAVKAELQNNGYVVTVGASAKDTLPGAAAAVSGVIVDVSCHSGESGKVELIGKIRRAGTEVLNKKYAANGTSRSLLESSAKGCAQSLTIALSASVKRFVADVDGMLGG